MQPRGTPGPFPLVTGLIGTGHVLSHLYMLCLPPLFPFLTDAFGLNYAALGLIMTVFATSNALAHIPSGILVDRFGGLPVLVGGLLTLGVSMGLIGLAPSYAPILVLAAVGGFANGVFHPAGYAILTASVESARVGKAYSIHQVSGSIGFVIAPVVMVALSTGFGFGWRTALLAVGALAVVQAVLLVHHRGILRSLPAAGETKTSASPVPLQALLRIPGLAPLFASFLGGAVLNLGLQAFLVIILTGYHGLDLHDAAPCLTVYLAAAVVGTLAGGTLADRTHRHAAWSAAAMLGSAVALVLLSGPETPLVVLMAGFAAVGFFFGLMGTPRDMMVRAVAPAGAVGRTFSVVSTAISVGGAISPLFIGLMIDHDLTAWVFAMLAGAFVFAAAMTLLADRARRHGATVASEATT